MSDEETKVYHPADSNGDGKVSRKEEAMYLEFKRKELEDADAMRDAQRNMAWFSLGGMLLYPFAVVCASLAGLDQAQKTLEQLPCRLLKDEVDQQLVADIISKWTQIPLSKLLQSEAEQLLCLEGKLERKIIGQQHALSTISEAIRRSRSGLKMISKNPLA